MVQYRWLALVALLIVPAAPAAAQQIKPRTIDLQEIVAVGLYVPIKPLTIELKGIFADGGYFPLKPRTIDLKGITADGGYLPLKPRTIALKGIFAAGLFVKISKTIQLPGWTASPPTRGKRF